MVLLVPSYIGDAVLKTKNQKLAPVKTKTPAPALISFHQELLQQRLLSRCGYYPNYELVQMEGAVQEMTFRYRVTVADFVALGFSRFEKDAMRAAAANVLQKIADEDALTAEEMTKGTPAFSSWKHSKMEWALSNNLDVTRTSIQFLENLCKYRRWSHPVYILNEEEDLPSVWLTLKQYLSRWRPHLLLSLNADEGLSHKLNEKLSKLKNKLPKRKDAHKIRDILQGPTFVAKKREIMNTTHLTPYPYRNALVKGLEKHELHPPLADSTAAAANILLNEFPNLKKPKTTDAALSLKVAAEQGSVAVPVEVPRRLLELLRRLQPDPNKPSLTASPAFSSSMKSKIKKTKIGAAVSLKKPAAQELATMPTETSAEVLLHSQLPLDSDPKKPSSNKCKKKKSKAKKPEVTDAGLSLQEAAKRELAAMLTKPPVLLLKRLLSLRGTAPKYEPVRMQGPALKIIHQYRVTAAGFVALGSGYSEKKAMQAAAKNVLDQIVGAPTSLDLGRFKKEAKFTASNNVIDKIVGDPGIKEAPTAEEEATATSSVSNADKIPGNPIRSLETCPSKQFCRGRWPPPPAYAYEEEGLPHGRIVTITRTKNKLREAKTGKSKMLARLQEVATEEDYPSWWFNSSKKRTRYGKLRDPQHLRSRNRKKSNRRVRSSEREA